MKRIIKVAWSTHLPALMTVMENSSGDVLELGTGHYSTPYLHWQCYLQDRKLVSYEDNLVFFRGNRDFRNFPTDFHEVNFVTDWNSIDIEKPWGVVFVDNDPPLMRKENIKRVANLAQFVVVHDTQDNLEHEYGYNEIYPLFKYRYDWKGTRAHTSILSNFVDVTIWKIRQ